MDQRKFGFRPQSLSAISICERLLPLLMTFSSRRGEGVDSVVFVSDKD
jgi:hypothetical protein